MANERKRLHSESDDVCKVNWDRLFQMTKSRKHCNFVTKQDCFKDSIFSLDSLQKVKERLNQTKSLLNDIDIQEWGKHTSFTDPSGLIFSEIKRKIEPNPELLTRAWLKFYDILFNFDLVNPQAAQTISSMHLCEAPGAFVTALNHYVKAHNENCELKWSANSLNPYYEEADVNGAAIIDDRFIRETYKNWFFDSTNTGNICNQNFVFDFLDRFKSDEFDFVTADGSVNCVDSPESQELIVTPLLYAEATIALLKLKSAGNFVLKVFTVFECQTVCLLYLLYCTFRNISLYKPVASKGGNSEIYVICTGFTPQSNMTDLLLYLHQNREALTCLSLFSLSRLDSHFLKQIEFAAQYFANHQIEAITHNLMLFQKGDFNRKNLIAAKKQVARTYIKRHNITSIGVQNRIAYSCDISFSNVKVPETCRFFKELENSLSYQGSFNTRSQERSNGCLSELLGKNLNIGISHELFEKWLDRSVNSLEKQLQFGMPFRSIKCSKFCSPAILQLFHNWQKHFCEEKTIMSFPCQIVDVLGSLFLDTPEEIGERTVIYTDDKNAAIANQFGEVQKLKVKTVQYCPIKVGGSYEFGSEAEAKLILIDLFDICVTDCNDCSKFKVMLQKSLHMLLNILPQISNSDYLIIQINAPLSRLVISILYCMAFMFDRYAFVPCLTPTKQTAHGLLCLFTYTNEKRLANARLAKVINTFNDTLDELIASQMPNDTLLEIASIPTMLQGMNSASFLGFCVTT